MKTDSILGSVKKVIGYPVEYNHFDTDLLMFINTEFSILHQHGVGPTTPFVVSSSTQTWGDFMGDDDRMYMVETLVESKARLLFDPPQNGSVIEILKETIKELEWRLFIVAQTIE